MCVTNNKTMIVQFNLGVTAALDISSIHINRILEHTLYRNWNAHLCSFCYPNKEMNRAMGVESRADIK